MLEFWTVKTGMDGHPAPFELRWRPKPAIFPFEARDDICRGCVGGVCDGHPQEGPFVDRIPAVVTQGWIDQALGRN